MDNDIRVKLMGVRGTMPVHGANCRVFGGATSCVFVKAAGEVVILDAGTGLSGNAYQEFFGSAKRFSLLLTHSHVDHIMGFPAFPPLFDPACAGEVRLKTREGMDARAQIEALMSPPLWPVKTGAFKARVEFRDVEAGFTIGQIQVDTMESNHPGGSTIYKLSAFGKSLVYATDYEPEGDAPEDFIRFAGGCSLLLLDAQYTGEDYLRTRGFGHSTIGRSAAIARCCGAEQTIFVHHDPGRTDAQLLELESSLNVPGLRFGREGEEVIL